WVGLGIANRMIRPIGNLIDAAKAVSAGDLNVQVKTEHLNNELDMLIQSFNTMVAQLSVQQKELIMSQKKAAWADIARKIAHEIKNPLTPIQLSAERLKKRYLHQIVDPTVFEQCVDTIIRQVSHIGNLVREFSNFARMPEAKMGMHDIIAILRSALILESSGRNIRFEERIAEDELLFLCDSQQMSQVFMNLLQNSIEALTENNIQNATIRVQLTKASGQIIIRIEDNGPGFSSLDKEKIMEPYFTTRQKGTGLGLAIVQKIVTDHGGNIHLGSSPMGGAMVTLIFQTKDH
ncbi:MAG: ATP-binding protein, partial [Alphaproteobacteria bacterium]|nr:ATP-binding protein [Alphaproteobacteria bacterium]